MTPAKAQDIEALASRSEALYRSGQLAEAETALRKLAGLLPDNPMVHYNLARVLKDRGRIDAAATALRKALGLAPAMMEGWLNLGTLLGESGRWAEAAEAFQHGLAAKPDSWQLLTSLGRVRITQGRRKEAEDLLRRSLALAPDAPPTLVNLGNLLSDHGSLAEAVSLFERAMALAPTMPEALMGAGNAVRKIGEMGRAIAYYEKAAAARPSDLAMRARLTEARLGVCDWRDVEGLRDSLIGPALKAPGAVGPMMSLTFPLPLTAKELLAFARQRAETVSAEAAPLKAVIKTPKPGPRERLTIGYMSADFHDHPTTHLMRGLFPGHDRSRFKVVTLALEPDDGSDYRRLVREQSDQFVELGPLDTLDAAKAIQAAGVDILVDINVHTRGNRLALTALRPAPVTVNWLGLPGTSGASFMDWALVDAVTCPPGHESDFSERVAVLPHCYQSNDRDQIISHAGPSRHECGLPPSGFVFCCFNQAFKIEPEMFGRWMRILSRVPGSVLWLLGGTPEMVANLRRAAETGGVDPDRLIFAARLPKDQHLARHRHADLFLDTLYYNAHTTASDALWAGVPVITAPGRLFAARVAASLLTHVGLPELICPDLDAYEELAARLASDPAQLAAIKAKLAANRLTTPLFDTKGFIADMERAYQMIWAEACAGKKTKRLVVP
ncbi:O-linked N-acetylglucosamine transferase, SPINDLY family protein [Paramagnetospirillum kuznetsovii]|uniref:O-linked N-acetylglucosamine transferase, SPINDLY family protein n=1 Tax=Paramagnetospirillum kuznetsovii TaxID=2053833 RepID=UPI0013750E6F|nr:tetratricopeptide repeat protein [Paramagnetospirillum kuznetsovii]